MEYLKRLCAWLTNCLIKTKKKDPDSVDVKPQRMEFVVKIDTYQDSPQVPTRPKVSPESHKKINDLWGNAMAEAVAIRKIQDAERIKQAEMKRSPRVAPKKRGFLFGFSLFSCCMNDNQTKEDAYDYRPLPANPRKKVG